MSANKTESLHFYDYLCKKIGSEKEVKVRRITFIADDISLFLEYSWQISSGSRSEGLDLKGSDIDLMYIDNDRRVYESEREAVKDENFALFIDTDDTQPCFTHIRLPVNYNVAEFANRDRNMIVQHGMRYLLSNEGYKHFFLNAFKSNATFINKIHGPCLSDKNDNYDLAYCLKCDKWISQAVPWLYRPRSSWISPETISQITMSGVLFVPIGFKGSKYEHLEWRLSFSLAEKVLIFSFNHTQLLCYALLKIVLKEIIETDKDLKGLLCSYYIKTLMFWISDDSDPSSWKPDNIIKCFMACLQRLLYSVENSTLLHYFISDYNFFESRISADLEKKKKMISLLNNLYQHGVQCFVASKTLHDYSRLPTEINKQFNINRRLLPDFLNIYSSGGSAGYEGCIPKLLKYLLYHSKTDLCSDIFVYCLSNAYLLVTQKSYTQNKQNNKQQYCEYKSERSHLLTGLHSDAVSGWLMLASFFYVHENYLISLDITNYALLKLTDEKIHNAFSHPKRNILTPKQESALDIITNERLITTLKTLTINHLHFGYKSQIIPKELEQDVINGGRIFHSFTFAHFLRFLCFYHLHDSVSCNDAMRQLRLATLQTLVNKESAHCALVTSTIFFGIAKQMMGETELLELFFELLDDTDHSQITSARTRLFELRVNNVHSCDKTIGVQPLK